jgi:transcriptional regulator with XRE-family HTH domain
MRMLCSLVGEPLMPRCNKQLRNLRKLRRLTQEELAELAIVGRRTLQKAERGLEVTMETVILLAAVLDVHPDEIIDQENVDARAAIEQMRENWISDGNRRAPPPPYRDG